MFGRNRNFFKALGPGILWAGAAIGVSHLVQSARAGASFGLGLVGLVIIANFFKYPAFSFGPRYAAATGTSLLEGYRRQGRWALWLYAFVTAGTMFTVQGAVTLVTASLAATILGVAGPGPVVALAAAITVACALLLIVGRYRYLDRITKVIVVLLLISTSMATVLVLPKVDWSTLRFLPDTALFVDPAAVLFMVALVGWMPSAFDLSIWHSLWTLARAQETGHAPTLREALLDFKIGYFFTALLALCFVTLGSGVMFHSGRQFADAPSAFADQVITLFTANLGPWSRPIIAVAALTTMFSTTLTVVDGFPRAIAALVSRFKTIEVPGQASTHSARVYWTALLALASGSIVLMMFFLRSLTALVDVATTLSFLSAPFLAWLNHRAMLGPEISVAARPGRGLIFYSWSGIGFSAVFALYFIWLRLQ